ncbi:protein NEGATIVE REGULATOR OF RESISTANCE-like [Salvia miltiorrhiza]|uniref:protein NEGATIVE REGULATOR OF RESISTANCE-like n=1 Tax=Salvia miltiorrhiza TaxID=226208 RepID=UPI0025AC71F2|nr:protein NEGATIVE REGULATOR OF RESISTANCE-like [Salvia miltiorrhiza]
MSSMEVEKRKRNDDGETNGKPREDTGAQKRATPPLPPDEEVEEFFAIVKRIRVALKYFQRRDGVRCVGGEAAAKPTWSPSFEREDFDGVKPDPEGSRVHEKTGLDLNSHPVSDASDSV